MNTEDLEVTLKVTPVGKERWDALCAKCELPSNSEGYTEVLKNAMRLYEDAINKTESGHKFLIQDKDGKVKPYEIF